MATTKSQQVRSTTSNQRSKHSLRFVILRAVTVLCLVTVTVFMIVSLATGSLGAVLISAPAVALGALAFAWMLWWPRGRSLNMRRGILLVLLVLFAGAGYGAFHILWKFVQPTVLPKKAVAIGNPWVIEGNVFSVNDYNNAVVVQLDDGTYRMYFHDHNDMMTAASTDGKKFGAPVKLFDGEMPTVVRAPSGQWRMYYFVNVNQPPAWQTTAPRPGQQPQPMHCADNCPAAKHNLVSAISDDGLHWTQEAGVRLGADQAGAYDADTMIHPSVIRLGDGSYKLYYDGEVDHLSSFSLTAHDRKILSASSPDGLTWTKDAGYRIDEKPLHTWEAYSPKAQYVDGKVVLRFTTPNGIYQASSTDTLHFTISKNPIFSPGRIPMPTDDGALNSYQDAYVLPVTGGSRMYFWIDGKGIFSAFQKD